MPLLFSIARDAILNFWLITLYILAFLFIYFEYLFIFPYSISWLLFIYLKSFYCSIQCSKYLCITVIITLHSQSFKAEGSTYDSSLLSHRDCVRLLFLRYFQNIWTFGEIFICLIGSIHVPIWYNFQSTIESTSLMLLESTSCIQVYIIVTAFKFLQQT